MFKLFDEASSADVQLDIKALYPQRLSPTMWDPRNEEFVHVDSTGETRDSVQANS
jgi:hypothetical protein